MEVVWHGHACFELRGKKVTVVFDPLTGIGLPEPEAEADIVLCSHGRKDHNKSEPVLKKGRAVSDGFVGSRKVQGVSLKGIATFHDAAGGNQRGKNSVYVVQFDGLPFCHLGDLGHDLTTREAIETGAVDVLFVPVGGGPTIGPDIASSIVQRLKPKIVVPMHYNLGLPGMPEFFHRPNRVDYFLRGKKNGKKIEGRFFVVTKENLPKEQFIWFPTYGI